MYELLIVLVALGGMGLGGVISAIMAERRWKDRFRSEELGRIRIEADLLRSKRELRQLESSIDWAVEDRLKKRIAEWSPSQGDINDDFRKAEYMATKRRTIDAGRLHPPVTSEGPPARISEINFHTGPVRPTDPK